MARACPSTSSRSSWWRVPTGGSPRAALEVVAEEVADGRTEVTVLLPRRGYTEHWHRLLHDRTSDSIAKALGVLPHANVTFVPYHLASAHHGGSDTEPARS